MRSVALALALTVFAGCSGPVSHPVALNRPSVTRTVPPTTTTTARPLPPPTRPLAVHPVGWLPCGAGLQCGTVAVPLDYQHPGGRIIGVAVERHAATDAAHRIGSLVINPGGPGDSGIDDLPTELRVLTSDLLSRFDVVSFDPRGVERSAPVHCSAGAATSSVPGPVPDPAPQTEAARRALYADDQAYAQACDQYSGTLLPFVGTVDAARDLDRIRAALGDDRLTFLGHSYGTLLGATYAELFPTHVRAMVLDGAIDPALSLDQMSADQAVGFDSNLSSFFQWCRTSATCAWRPSGDPGTAFGQLLASVRAHPLVVGGRTVGPGEFLLGVLGTLYAQSFWPSLGRALAGAQRSDGSALLALSDAYQRHGSANAVDANAAITCADHPVSRNPDAYPPLAAAAAEKAPVFGPVFAWGELECAPWPAIPSRSPRAIRAAGAPPILIVGTTRDPATPYAWAVALAGELQHGVLVTRQGVDHVAYYYSACVRAIDARYLVAGVTPPTATVCSS